jgi:hypothetical protein
MSKRTRWSGFLVIAAVAVAGILVFHRPEPLAKEAAGPVGLPEKPAPTNNPEPQIAPAPEQGAAVETVKTRIAADTPAIYRTPYFPDRVPVEIRSDGTQIFEGIPVKVRQPDGTMKEIKTRMTIQPTKPVPVLLEDPEPATRKQ